MLGAIAIYRTTVTSGTRINTGCVQCKTMTSFLKTVGTTIKSAFSSNIEMPEHSAPTKYNGYEERHYPKSMWVSTEVKAMQHEDARREGFWRLFGYIQGKNEKEMKIDMTAPVATQIFPGAGPNCESTFIVSFYIGKEHRDNPPKPTNPDVFIQEWPAKTLFVRQFDGFSNDTKYLNHAQELVGKLEEDGQKFIPASYYTAGYDSPYKMFDRRNEVWFEKRNS